MKAWYTSKTVWINTITLLIAVASLALQQEIIPVEAVKWVLFGSGVLNLILRIWFTDTELAS